jgi:hypothetical protein
MRAPATRREFLKATAATAAALAAASPAVSQSKGGTGMSGGQESESSGQEAGVQWRPGGPKKETVILDKPHVVTPDSPYLNSSGEIANKRFLLDPTKIGPTGFPTGTTGKLFGVPYKLSAFGLLTLPPGSKNIRIVDCEFEGPWRSIDDIPELRPGGPKYLKGIQMFYASGIRIEGCAFDYLPTEGIYFYGCVGVEIEDVWSRNCTQLVRADWMGVPRNLGYASVYETGRAIGVNAVSGYYADSEISNLTTSGEVKMGLKLANPVRVALDRIYSSRFMIQGTVYWNGSGDPSQGNGKLGAYNPTGFDEQLGDHAVDVMITRSRFRPHQNAWFRGSAGNTVQLSFHQEKIRFRDCVFYKPDQSVHKHQAIQAWDGVEVDARDCVFVGWKKPADPLPPFPEQTIVRVGTYRKPGSLPASINADFSRVNEFRPLGPQGQTTPG